MKDLKTEKYLNHPLLRMIKIAFLLNIKSERTWIFGLFVPAFITVIILFSYSMYSQLYSMLPPQIMTTLLTPSIFIGCYFGITLVEWRNSFLLKRIKFVGIKSHHLITTFILLSIFFTTVSTIFDILISYIISLFVKVIPLHNLHNLFFWNWIWFFFIAFAISTLAFLISLLGSNFISNKSLAISYIILVITFVYIFSDILIPSFSSTRNQFLTYFGYINIFKYGSWLLMLTSAFANIDYNGGIQQIIFDDKRTETIVFINNTYVCLVILILAICFFTYFGIRTFKWKG